MSDSNGLDFFGLDPPPPGAPADLKTWFKSLPDDLKDAVLAGFEIQLVDAAARAGNLMLGTTIDEIRRVRSQKLLSLKAHPDVNPHGNNVTSVVNKAATAMMERRR